MISKIVNKDGFLYFDIDGKIIDSFAFKSFRPTKKNISEFYEAGVRLFHIYCSGLASGLKVPYSLFGECWVNDHQYDFSGLDRQIELFKENAPNGYGFVNIHLDTRPWWLEQNPGNVNSFTHLSQIAANEKWRKDTADYLKALIQHTEAKYGDYIAGYFLLGGYTTEWFSEFDHEESHPIKEKAYQAYLKDEKAKIPGPNILSRPIDELFLKENVEEIVTYRKFHNHLIADTVNYFAKEAQSVLHHQKILGLFFGYILELLYQRLWEAGHIEFDEINHNPDIDLLATPSSYQFRGYDQPGAFMLLCDSLEKNNKACFISFDHTTFLVPTLADNPKRICGDPDTNTALRLLAEMRSRNKKDLLKDAHDTIQAMRREYMQRTIKRVGYWWFDMFEGWFYDERLMNEVKNEIEISKALMNVNKKSISEVCVFISGQSLYKVNKNSEFNTECICNQRGGLAKMGAPYDIYSLSDFSLVDIQSYKLFIFIAAFELSEEQEEWIQQLKIASKNLLFIGPVNYLNKGLESVNEILEMKLKPVTNKEKSMIANGYEYGYENEKKDSFSIISTVHKLGYYANSKEIGFGYVDKDSYKIFYSGLGNLSYEALREVLKLSNVHLYTDKGIPCYVCNNLTGIYAPSEAKTTLYLKEDGQYLELFSNQQYQSFDKKITLDTTTNAAAMLLKL